MKKAMQIIILFLGTLESLSCQKSSLRQPSKVDFESFEELAKEVRPYRAKRLVSLEEFHEMSKDSNTVILDTRSKEMYQAKHIRNARHLEFSNFSVRDLARVIPNKNTRILIYCNNNILDDSIFFISKSTAKPLGIASRKIPQELTLALNIPTFINLYGYGYMNIYELSESIRESEIHMEGTAVQK